MDRRRVFRNAFLWNALVSALMAGAALYARSGARGWLAAGWCIGVAASAAALACFCKAWAAAPDGTAVTGWYLLRVAAMLAAVAGTAAFSMEGALGGHSAAACTGAAPCGGDAVGGTARAQKR